MWCLTEDAKLVCAHRGNVKITYSQKFVTIHKKKLLVKSDPVGKSISKCPNFAAAIKPCLTTLVVKEGYSDFVRIGGRPVCLDTVTGLTDGTPPGFVEYSVRKPGQKFVAQR